MHGHALGVFDRLYEMARATWPRVHVSMADFTSHLTEHLGLSPDAAEARSARAGDLYLAVAAARGDAEAISIIDRTCITRIDPALHGMLPASEIDDLKQRLRQQIFTGTSGPPKILSYAGRGELRVWVRATAVHTALSTLRAMKRARTREQNLWLAMPACGVGGVGGVDPTVEQLRPRFQVEFKAAFESALHSLEPRERNVLKQHFVDGLSIDELAVLYRVHRTTAFRWLTRARQRVLALTRKALAAQLALCDSQLDSLMQLIDSQLDVSAVRLLAATGSTAA